MLSNIFGRFQPRKVLLAGDLNIDTYTLGEVSRISPEAPVPILRAEQQYSRPGCAGNAALNICALGMQVRLLGRIGSDEKGKELRMLLEEERIDLDGVVEQCGWPTPVKERLIAAASNQQMVRVDYEVIAPLDPELEAGLIERLGELLDGIDLVAISDYGKGVLSPALLEALIQASRERSIPVIVDPKGRDFSRYSGATVIKPNQREAYAAADLDHSASLAEAARMILEETGCDHLLVTRASEGASLYSQEGKEHHYEVKIREVRDVTGAGDTVLAVLVAALANRLTPQEGVKLAMVAAGLAVEHLGCAVVTLPDLARRLFEDDCMQKVFGSEHLFALQQALNGTPYGLLSVSSQDGISTSLLRHMRTLSDKPLILYVEEEEPDDDYIQLLASLADVRYIVVKRENLQELCAAVPPEQRYRFTKSELVQV